MASIDDMIRVLCTSENTTLSYEQILLEKFYKTGLLEHVPCIDEELVKELRDRKLCPVVIMNKKGTGDVQYESAKEHSSGLNISISSSTNDSTQVQFFYPIPKTDEGVPEPHKAIYVWKDSFDPRHGILAAYDGTVLGNTFIKWEYWSWQLYLNRLPTVDDVELWKRNLTGPVPPESDFELVPQQNLN